MKLFLKSFAIGYILLSSGCGALFNGGPQSVNITSEPNGAEVWVDGSRMGVTPIGLDLSKKSQHTVTFKMPGKTERTYIINRKIKSGFIILDVLGGLFPVVIDAATGSWYGLESNSLHGVLTARERSELLHRGIFNASRR
jgi:hypothetical protein